MANYNYEKFDQKQAKAIGGIARAMGCDLGVARAMLIDMADKQEANIYQGLPEDYDLDRCAEDVAELRDQFKQ